MNLEQTLKIHNKFDIRVLDAKSGEIKHEQTAYNIVLDKMYERLLNWMPFFQGIAFGTGSGVPATSDTTLFQYLGWKQMGQTDCGTIEEIRDLPLVSRKRRITLHADEYVGQTITEIGVAYSSSTSTGGDGNTTYGGIVTHAMLSQPILKTELDVIQIDATVYLNFGSYLMSAYGDRVYWGPNGDLIDYFMGGTFPTCRFYASKGRIFDNIVNGSSLGATATVSRTEWIKDALNKKLTTPVRRFDISDANGAIRGIGFGSAENKGIFGSVFPIPDVFEGYSIEGDSLGIGDGVQTGFNFTWNDVKRTGIEIFVNGAKQTSGFTLEPNRISSSFVKKSALAALSGTGRSFAFSLDGTYLAVAHNNSPYITVYKRDGDSFTKLSALEALPSVGYGCAFSPDGTYLAVAHSNSPCLTVYKRDGDSFTKLSGIEALPGVGWGCAFSPEPDGTYLAVAHYNSPCLTVYKRDGDSFTKLSGIEALPSTGYGCAFSPDGTYLAVAYSNSPYITVYKRDGDSFTKLSGIEALPDLGYGCAFSPDGPDGTYLAVAHGGSPYITVYKRDGDSFTKLSALEALPSTGMGCAFSPDGTYLAVAHGGSPYITVYKRDGDSFTKLSALEALPSTGMGCAFSPDGTYLAVGHSGSSCLTVYQKDIHEPLREYNVVFDDPPAAGAVITANYEVPYIPKDSNHILDVQFSIQWV